MPSEDTACGQYIEIAMPVKKAATSGGIPLSATCEYTLAKDLPGSTSIGHTDLPSATVSTGLLNPTPAPVSADRKASSIGSACAGAATVAVSVVRPTATATIRNVDQEIYSLW